MSKLLVTGGAGFIGANFVRYWRAKHPDDAITVLDALTYAGNRASLDGVPAIGFVHGDVRDTSLVQQLLEEHEISTLVHFAAETHVDRSIGGPDAFIDTNVTGTHSLLKAARAVWLEKDGGRPHRFHHVSTDEVYGSLRPYDPAFTETTPYAPNSPYSASKAASDHLVRAYHQTYGLKTTISLCSNNYGPYQFPEKLIPLVLINALSGKPLPVYGDGMNIRDWLHVEDHCRAVESILKHGAPGESYNVGASNELSNIQVVEQICGVVDTVFEEAPLLRERFPACPAARFERTASSLAFVPDRPGHDRRYAVDAGKIRRRLNFTPAQSFREGLRGTVGWYLNNESWWRPLLARAVPAP
jgi:dTDP-glucose 4,6-dehydratase